MLSYFITMLARWKQQYAPLRYNLLTMYQYCFSRIH